MQESLLKTIKTLPDSAGIYMYFDNAKLLYVGKAKNLKKRVRSYFTFTPKLAPNPKNSQRIKILLEQTTNIKFTQTKSELDALILENSLIKQLKPKYNILLRDDKTYPYLYIDYNEEFPQVLLSRRIINNSKIKYYGPFAKGANELLKAIYLLFQIRQKKSCKSRCLFYDLKKCLAPCEFDVKDEYNKQLEQVIKAILKPSILLTALNEKMSFYAENEEYEQAASIRDIIKGINNITLDIQTDLAKDIDFDLFAYANNENFCSYVRFIIKGGKLISVINKKIATKYFNANEFLTQLIMLTYKDSIDINEIIIQDDIDNIEILKEYLSNKAKKSVNIHSVKIGQKKKLLDLAIKNAQFNLKENKNEEILLKIQNLFNLSSLCAKIEAFDNSHFQADSCIGAMISYDAMSEEFQKELYRTYNLNANNDYEQMKEVLSRRILSFDKINAPDLWLIDGGKALLDLANSLLEENGLNIEVIAIAKEKINHLAHRAKGNAKDKLYYKNKEYILKANDEILLFFQKLRDEAHRFAISTHKKQRTKKAMQSSKLEQLNISSASINKLLRYFGTYEAIYKASYGEIKKVSNKSVADKIFNLTNVKS